MPATRALGKRFRRYSEQVVIDLNLDTARDLAADGKLAIYGAPLAVISSKRPASTRRNTCL